MTTIYLDSSAIVKRYVLEPKSEEVSKAYHKALNGELTLSFSTWNIGEVLGVFDMYHRRGWLDKQGYEKARYQFIGEVMKLLRLKLLKMIPVKTKLVIRAWPLIEKYHIYEADALQIVSAEFAGAHNLYTGDRQVYEIAVKEGIDSVCLS